jgi:hypothetical protein
MMYPTLKSYLARIEEEERTKPETRRRPVPTVADLARAAGVTPQAIYKIINGGITAMSFATGGAILAEFRRRGFPTQVGDLIGYADAESEGAGNG